jgi:hypothetical protein
VVTSTQAPSGKVSLLPAVNGTTRMPLSFDAPRTVHLQNWSHHCMTPMVELQSTSVPLCTRLAAATPTSVLPAPQGSTTMPERARPLPNIFSRQVVW